MPGVAGNKIDWGSKVSPIDLINAKAHYERVILNLQDQV
jgi:hypothetical protein